MRVRVLVAGLALVVAGTGCSRADDPVRPDDPVGDAGGTPGGRAVERVWAEAREAEARSALFDVSHTGSDTLADRNARAGLSSTRPPHYVEPPPGVRACFVSDGAWLAIADLGDPVRGHVALGEGPTCPVAGDAERPFPTAQVLGRLPLQEAPGKWLRNGDLLAPDVPVDLFATAGPDDLDLGLSDGQFEAIDLARLLFSSLEVHASDHPGRRPPRRLAALRDYEPWGFELRDADRIRDYRVVGSTVSFCALAPDGAWVSVSSEADVIATAPSDATCSTR